MSDNRAYLQGWQAAAEYIGWSVWTLRKYARELKRKGIAWRQIIGTPPNRRVVIRVWKNLLQAWAMEKN